MATLLAPLEGFVESFLPASVLEAALSTCNLTTTGVSVGLACLAVQIVFYVLFAYVLPPGPWKDEPGFTAHQVVVVPLISYVAYVGCVNWSWSWSGLPLEPGFATVVERATKIHPIGSHLSQVVLGELILWDTPVGLIVPSLRIPEMLAHHILMAGVAYLSFTHGVMSYFTVCYFGAVNAHLAHHTLPAVSLTWMHPHGL